MAEVLSTDAEDTRLKDSSDSSNTWQRWGTYLPERQWGTVREDYSPDGECWTYFPFGMASYRAYRWGEDGLLGWTDRECRLCFSTSLWNGCDPILKERLFGLANGEGNHGEDVKELYYYLDATPTHSYAKGLYKYPQRAFPYEDLKAENKRRGTAGREYELLDTGLFDENRYFDVTIEYAKADAEDILIRITVANRGPEAAELTVLPTFTFRNEWSWFEESHRSHHRPTLKGSSNGTVAASHDTLGNFQLIPITGSIAEQPVEIIFTENDTNIRRMNQNSGDESEAFTKDAFERYIVQGEHGAVNPAGEGTKAAFVYRVNVAPGNEAVMLLRMVRVEEGANEIPEVDALACFSDRTSEADSFYDARMPVEASDEEKNVSRQAYAGLLWSKQFYYFVAEEWLAGDKTQPSPPGERRGSSFWKHLFCKDVLSVPDKWEYPWFAAWDLAFHMIPMAVLDPAFAKAQLLLLLREWYLHPNGQMPAYEFKFGDVNPPVHAWAVWNVYRNTAADDGTRDTDFLERAFQKLLLNFTWWVNHNDSDGRNLFGGGFLGLDNIGVFDRSELPAGISLDQADATAWMGHYCSCMLQMAIELAQTRPAYEDIANKFFEHYIAINRALNTSDGTGLWDEEDGFYFDRMTRTDGTTEVLRVRSVVSLASLFGVCIVERGRVENLHELRKRAEWFREHNPEADSLFQQAAMKEGRFKEAFCIALVPKERLVRILQRMLDESEFLSPYGLRSVSKYHDENPFKIQVDDETYEVAYAHAESANTLFGGNSNWRGPVWIPMNAFVVLALDQYYLVYGDDFKVECPTGSGTMMTLQDVSSEICRRVASTFLPDASGARPCHDNEERYATDEHWKNLVLFNEYFSGDTGRGVGASHQTGWTALAASVIQYRYTSSEDRLRFV